jgi:hypothetical protein
MSLAGTSGDRLGLIRALQVVRLHRTGVILIVGSVADKRTPSVDLRITTAGNHRGAGYSLSALIVIAVT